MNLLLKFAMIVAVASITLTASAQTSSSKQIRIVVPFAAGSGTDVVCRVYVNHFSLRSGLPTLVENKPGGNGVIGVDYAVKAPADGSTALCLGGGSMAASLHASLPWEFLSVLDPVILMHKLGLFLVVTSKLPVNTLGEFIAYAKANPGKLNYYSVAANQQLAFALFADRAGINMVHVPYKGGQAHVDLLAGLVHAGMDGPAAFKSHLEAGRVKMLFVGNNVRAKEFPSVPTATEAGLGDLELPSGTGFWVPAGTPADAVAKLNAGLNEALKAPEVIGIITGTGGVPMGGAAELLRRQVSAEHQLWNRAAKLANYVPQP